MLKAVTGKWPMLLLQVYIPWPIIISMGKQLCSKYLLAKEADIQAFPKKRGSLVQMQSGNLLIKGQ